MAHGYGLSVGLKNDVDATQVSTLLPYFDFAVNEQCFQYHECAVLQSFVQAGKPVFNVEYKGKPSSYCPAMNDTYDFNSAHKKLSLFDDARIEEIIRTGQGSASRLRGILLERGIPALVDDGVDKILSGETTVDEVSQAVGQFLG